MKQYLNVIYQEDPEQSDIGLVVGCDYYVGITIINAYDHDEFLFCAPGPLAPRKSDEPFDLDQWERYYYYILECIHAQEFSIPAFCRYMNLSPESVTPTQKHCPFGQ